MNIPQELIDKYFTSKEHSLDNISSEIDKYIEFTNVMKTMPTRLNRLNKITEFSDKKANLITVKTIMLTQDYKSFLEQSNYSSFIEFLSDNKKNINTLLNGY